jgi:hypothetical protein
MNNMMNLNGLSLDSVEARIEHLIQIRMSDSGENHQLAELSVVRSPEGLALWEQARKLRMAEAPQSAPDSVFSRNTAASIAPQAKLETLIEQRMSDTGETCAQAENSVIHTSEGLELWNRFRGLRLADSCDED